MTIKDKNIMGSGGFWHRSEAAYLEQ